MRLFLYEFVTGGGWRLVENAPPGGSLLTEGRAMLLAAALDFLALEDVEVDIPWDARLATPPELTSPRVRLQFVESATDLDKIVSRLAAAADWSLVVAPEFDNHLLYACRQVIAAGGRLLGPTPEFIAIASDKHATA
ncbi:MAG: hypothetical protein KDA41_03340, partial [Planctomycetales bacterium]|nr:hypothetical protein [Planctomycetales bacterium]